MSELKTSLFVNRQVPEFIRDEYPAFISFLEAYYEFLETKQTGINNDLITKAKNLRTISDVDESIDEFEQSFFNTYASLVPRNVEVDKTILLKNLLPLYLSKGNEKAFKLLFRLVFDTELEITYPKNNVLRASDGNWKIDNKFRINAEDISSVYTANGKTKTFMLAQIVTADEITVYINNVLQTTGFTIQKEYRKITFNVAPTNGQIVRVYYKDFQYTLFNNRQIIGLTSGAVALVEIASKRIITDRVNVGFPIDLNVDTRTIVGTFLNGEIIRIPIVDVNGNLIEIRSKALSNIKKINVTKGGSNYNVGDPIIVFGGNPSREAAAIVTKIFDGFLNRIEVVNGGACFTLFSNVNIVQNISTALALSVDGVDVSGNVSGNTYTISTDLINDYKNVLISAADYGFPSTLNTAENVYTTIANALTYQTLTVGPITNVAFLTSNASVSFIPDLDAEGASYLANTVRQSVKSFGSIGKIQINNGGSGYIPGDEILFGPNPIGTYGQGAAAVVSRVNSTGRITLIEIQPSRVSGTVSIANNNVTVAGVSTDFINELKPGDKIVINNEVRFVNTISSLTGCNVNVAFTTTATGKKLGVYGRTMLGGIGYIQNNFPTVSVSSTGGVDANIEIYCVASDGERLYASSGGRKPGEILEIQIVDAGEGYQVIPTLRLDGIGDGSATASAEIEEVIIKSSGRWTSSDSLLSALDNKIQGSNYYIDYSYITSSEIEFSRYKKLVKDLLHPVGFVNYAGLNRKATFSGLTTNTANISIIATKQNQVSGLINVANTIYITGTNTKFNVANTLGILSIGSNVAVNGEIRTISTIISNTNLSVTSAFTQLANSQVLLIV